jgi:Helix-turn-helix domain
MDRTELAGYLDRGLSFEAIARLVDRDPSTIAYWARKHGLTTVRHWLRVSGLTLRRAQLRAEAKAAREAGQRTVRRDCPRHGWTTYWLEQSGYFRCGKCRGERVSRRRRRVKEILIEEAGGRCRLCGYDRATAALEFHHLDPATKAFGLATGGLTRSLAACRAEARKCVLLCSNCHAEVETGVTALSLALDPG